MAASTDEIDKCKPLSTSNLTKPTSSTNQPNKTEHNGKHSINERASRMELNNLSSDLSQDSELNLQQVNASEIQTPTQTQTQVNRLNSSEELNNVPDTTTTEIESNGRKMSPTPMSNKSITPKSERKVFVPTNVAERKPTEVAGIVIKKDYLPPPTPPAKSLKVEKTRDDVTRVLNYDTEPNTKRPVSTAISGNDTKSIIDGEKIKVEKCDATIKTEPSDTKISDEKPAKKSPTSNHISENKENSLHKIEASKKPKDNSDTNKKIKSELKSRESSCEKKDSKTSSSNEHRHHSSKSSSSKSSSHHSSSSSRDCSRCYRRSKTKRASVGVQCCKYGEPFKQMTPTSTPLKSTQTLACNMTDSLYSDLKYGRFFHGKFLDKQHK